MAMKETVGSLRAYFAVAGAYSGWQGWNLYQAAAPLGEIAKVFIWIAILVGHATRCTLSVIRFNQGNWRHIVVK